MHACISRRVKTWWGLCARRLLESSKTLRQAGAYGAWMHGDARLLENSRAMDSRDGICALGGDLGAQCVSKATIPSFHNGNCCHHRSASVACSHRRTGQECHGLMGCDTMRRWHGVVPFADKDEGFHHDDQGMLNDVTGAAVSGLLINAYISRRASGEWRMKHGQVRHVSIPDALHPQQVLLCVPWRCTCCWYTPYTSLGIKGLGWGRWPQGLDSQKAACNCGWEVP